LPIEVVVVRVVHPSVVRPSEEDPHVASADREGLELRDGVDEEPEELRASVERVVRL
jgi:hypothetical protein